MTTIEHLQRIKAKCERLLAAYASEHEARKNYLAIIGSTEVIKTTAAEAGWRSTIAAIDLFLFNDERLSYGYAPSKQERQIIQSILSAWPEELLS